MQKTGSSYTRRRALSILAAGAALPLAGKAAFGTQMQPYRWQGLALGAQADLTLYAASRRAALDALAESLKEIDRLERIFSLHRPDSALSQLNRTGELATPPVELVELLSVALLLSDRSGGRFDPSIQPLWELYATHFAKVGVDAPGPDAAQLAAMRDLVDWRLVAVSPARISFARPGMQVTLNGIAQGYISDRVATLLGDRGFTHTLINLGELRALGAKPDGASWQIGLSAPRDHADLRMTEPLSSGALATSAGTGLSFNRSGSLNHIIDARDLNCANPDYSVTVRSQSAAVADGLSTLGAMMIDAQETFGDLLRQFQAEAIIIGGPEREPHRIG